MRRYHLTTFGCQMNEHDSERMKGMLETLGYSEAAERREADLILFNTCSIREKADNRLVGHLGEARRLKREDPSRVIGVGGCWSQSMKERVFEQFPFVDVAFGPGQVHKLGEFLTSDSLTAQGYFEFEGFTGHLPPKRERRHQAWVQISVGCNCRCAYCIVPSTRGREVSRPAAEIVTEVERLAADGVREVTLLGQNVNSYGRDLRPVRTSFAELLGLIDAVQGIERIRYTSPHPKDMRADVVRAHAELRSLCEHIHLPLQSGSSRILKAMRRTYDRERYLDRVAAIRELVPDVALTTDIIVGFPGETEEDFEGTLELVERVRYDSAFTFIYSPRRGTEAATLPDQVSHELAGERMERLVEAVQRIATERAQRFVGRTMEVLVEGPSRTDPAKLRGRIRHNKTVNFDGVAAPGDLCAVDISSATSTTLAGEQRLLAAVAGWRPRLRVPPEVIALFGPTGVGKTGVAIALAELLRARGEDPVAISADALQVYRGLETLTGAATAEERRRLEHRLLSFVPLAQGFSAGEFAARAHAEIDAALERGRRPLLVGGTGLYLQAALRELDLRPPPPPGLRARVEAELRRHGPQALHARLAARAPEAAAATEPGDRVRVTRALELLEMGERPAPTGEGSRLWTARLRRPTLLFGLTMERAELYRRIDARVERMLAAGAVEEVRRAEATGPSRTARNALGYAELLRGDPDAMKRRSRNLAKRQLTWMRKLPGVHVIDVTGRRAEEVAAEVAGRLGG